MTYSLNDRHPSTQHMLEMFVPNPNLPSGLPKTISEDFHNTAQTACINLQDSPELTAGLRKLLEAKDCFIRAAVLVEPVDYRDR